MLLLIPPNELQFPYLLSCFSNLILPFPVVIAIIYTYMYVYFTFYVGRTILYRQRCLTWFIALKNLLDVFIFHIRMIYGSIKYTRSMSKKSHIKRCLRITIQIESLRYTVLLFIILVKQISWYIFREAVYFEEMQSYLVELYMQIRRT